MSGCLLCGGTLSMADGTPCPNCKEEKSVVEISVPEIPEIPLQYQGVKFDKSFLPSDLQGSYGTTMESLLSDIVDLSRPKKNLLICSRPNSGKTVWAYSVFGTLYQQGHIIPTIKDIIEVRDIIYNMRYGDDRAEQYSEASICIIKIPLDLPTKVFETMSSIVERRVRHNGSTIFLYSGTKQDLLKQDTFGKFKTLIGDGNFNSIKIVDSMKG